MTRKVTQVPEVRFPIGVVEGVPVVTAPEEIDVNNAPTLQAALLEAAGPGAAMVVVDMSRTRFCDCSGLHALVAAHRRAQAGGGDVLLVIPGAAVLRVLAITGIDQVIPDFASLDEALAQAPAARADAAQAGRTRAWPARRPRAAPLAGNAPASQASGR